MRTIEPTGQFKRNFKRGAKGPHRQTLQVDFTDIITALANDLPLADKHRDHALTGGWKDHRDCLLFRQTVRLAGKSRLSRFIHDNPEPGGSVPNVDIQRTSQQRTSGAMADNMAGSAFAAVARQQT